MQTVTSDSLIELDNKVALKKAVFTIGILLAFSGLLCWANFNIEGEKFSNTLEILSVNSESQEGSWITFNAGDSRHKSQITKFYTSDVVKNFNLHVGKKINATETFCFVNHDVCSIHTAMDSFVHQK